MIVPFHPGVYLREELETRGLTQSDFARQISRPEQAISEIVCGKKRITADTALDVASALGTSAELWMHLQATWDLHEARQRRLPPEEEQS